MPRKRLCERRWRVRDGESRATPAVVTHSLPSSPISKISRSGGTLPMLSSVTSISSAMTFGLGPRLRADVRSERACAWKEGENGDGHSKLKDMMA